MIAHEPDCLVGADARFRSHRKIDCAETVGSAINKVAEKDDRAPVAQPGLPRGLVDQRGEKIAPPVNVANGEDLRLRAYAQRQRKFLTLDDYSH